MTCKPLVRVHNHHLGVNETTVTVCFQSSRTRMTSMRCLYCTCRWCIRPSETYVFSAEFSARSWDFSFEILSYRGPISSNWDRKSSSCASRSISCTFIFSSASWLLSARCFCTLSHKYLMVIYGVPYLLCRYKSHHNLFICALCDLSTFVQNMFG